MLAAASIGLSVGASGCDLGPAPGGPGAGDAGAGSVTSATPKKPTGRDADDHDASERPGGLMLGPNGQYVLPDGAAPPPTPFEPDETVPAEEYTTREATSPGVVLQAVWRWRELPKPPDGPLVVPDAIAAAKAASEMSWVVEIASTGRMRARFDGIALPLPKGSELQGRADRYGTIVLWPNGTRYRVVTPGALRSALGERRVDVGPLTAGRIAEKSAGQRLDLKTRVVELATPLGKLRMETAKVPEAGRGSVLPCRMLVEIVGVLPSTRVCVEPELAVAAEFSWADGGGVSWEVTSLTRRTDLAAADFLVPPPGAAYEPSGLPSSEGIFFARELLAAFRKEAGPAPKTIDRSVPGEGVMASNHSDRFLYLLLDGVPIASTPPWTERYVLGPRNGRYNAQWRSFLGDLVEPAAEVDLPARVSFGPPDAGAPSRDAGP